MVSLEPEIEETAPEFLVVHAVVRALDGCADLIAGMDDDQRELVRFAIGHVAASELGQP
jgi:hypothetical protein